jgi:hypothetical protein
MDKQELDCWGKQLERELSFSTRKRIKKAVDLVFRDYGDVLRRLGRE